METVISSTFTPHGTRTSVPALRDTYPYGHMARGWVYVVEGEGGRLKIGWTADLERRIPLLERSLGYDVYVWGIAPGTRADEAWLHERWSHRAVGHEWFEWDDDLVAAAEEGRLLWERA